MEWKSWKYKNLTLLACTFVVSVLLGGFKPLQVLLFETGLPAAFFAGIIFISTFAAPIAAMILLVLAEKFPLPQLWIVASIAATLSDFLFFKFTKDGLGAEIEPIYENLAENHTPHVLHTKHFRWLFPVIGAVIVLSPFPKTEGLHLLGIPRLKNHQFIALSAFVNVVGIAFILFLSFFIKP